MHRRQGHGSVTFTRAALLAVGLASLLAGCGGGSGDSDAEAQDVIESFKSLKPGEILIQGQRAEKFSGPYQLRKGGYVLHFRRLGEDGAVTIALESQRGSSTPPYELMLDDFAGATAQRKASATGKFYVHVKSSADGYVLRFTPRRAG
jgi:hypothetical protein